MTTHTPQTSSVTRSVEDLVTASPDVDNRATFEALTSLFADLRAKIWDRFQLRLDPSCDDIRPYHNLKGEVSGSVSAFVGPEIDWAISSWMGTPESSFTNLHLSVWLGPQTRVPHLWLAVGTIPQLFVYMDFGPRAELATDHAYLERYYQGDNERYLDFCEDPAFVPFVSRSVSVRSFISPVGTCCTAEPTLESIAKVSTAAHQMVDRWLGWLDNPEEVPLDLQPALATRDLYVRRQIAETDPANRLAERLLGAPLTARLVRALWGGDRTEPRPGSNQGAPVQPDPERTS